MNNDFGGYDYNFVEDPPDRLVCKICCFPCREAQQSKCCGHVFCKSCLDTHIYYDSTKSSCPVCRTEKFVSFPQHQADREIRGFLVYCPNKDSGCEWVGEFNDIHQHNKDGKCCDVKCKKCDKILPSTGVKSHLDTECPCYCPYCDITAEREVISSEHKEKCHKFPLTCPNNCGLDNIPRDNMDEHRKECPLEMILCEYYDVGCATVMPRKDQQEHNSENFYRFHHLQLVYTNQTTQAITTAASFTTVHYSWSQLVFTFIVVLITQAVIVKVDHSSKCIELFEHIQQYHPTLLWSIFLNDSTEQSSHGDQVAPVVLKLSDFSDIVKHRKRWYSSPFIAFRGGYQMYLGINHSDISMHDRVLLSASLYLMQGPHDNALEHLGDQQLPFKGKYTIELLNQLSDSDHIAKEVTLVNSEVCKRECSEVALDGEVVRKCGYPVSVPHDILLHENATKYIRSNSLYFRVSYKKANSLHYIMHYLIKPSIAGLSVIAEIMILDKIPIHNKDYKTLPLFAYTAALGCYMNGSVPRGITWTMLYFILFFKSFTLEIKKYETLLSFLMLTLGGCLATVLLDILLYIWDVVIWWVML